MKRTSEIFNGGMRVDVTATNIGGVGTGSVGLEIQFNEFSKMIQEEAQRMIIEDLDPAAVAKTMHEKAEALQ